MSELIQEIFQSLRQGKELVIATIISGSGSTPRTSGAKMIVYRDGQASGTIGGGSVEADAAQTALHLFNTQKAIISTYNLTQATNVDRMDLICGGQMQVLLEHVPASDEHIAMYGAACEEMSARRPFFLVSRVKEDDAHHWQAERSVQTARKKWVGSLQLTPELQRMLEARGSNCSKTSVIAMEGHSYIVEPVIPPDTVYLIGAGHVAKEIAVLSKQVGFRTIVLDDRAEFANPVRFPDAAEIHVCPDFSGMFEKFDITASSYIIIVTRGHRFDKEALAQALQTKAEYIGMIGSRKKRDTIYQTLMSEGFQRSGLDQVYCPIGLSIGAETPAEIGVSVVAELIQHRAVRKNHG